MAAAEKASGCRHCEKFQATLLELEKQDNQLKELDDLLRDGFARLTAELLDLHDIADTAVEKSPSGGIARAVVRQPIEKRRAVDAAQHRALGVIGEIAGAVARCAPHRIDAFGHQARAERGMLRQCEERRRAPRGSRRCSR